MPGDAIYRSQNHTNIMQRPYIDMTLIVKDDMCMLADSLTESRAPPLCGEACASGSPISTEGNAKT